MFLRKTRSLVGAGFVVVGACATPGGGVARDPDESVRGVATAAAPAELAEGAVGQVLTAPGRPIAGAHVAATSLDEPARPIPDIAILSGVDGRFAWRLRPGRYRLAALVAGVEIAAATAIVAPGRVTPVELTAVR